MAIQRIHDSALFAILGLILLGDMIILIPFTAQSPGHRHLTYGSTSYDMATDTSIQEYQEGCTSEYSTDYYQVIGVYKLFLLLWGGWLAYQVREVKIAHLNDSKYIGWSIWNVTIFAIIIVAVNVLSTNMDVILVFTSIGVILLVGVVLSFMFVPKVCAVYKLTAEAAKQHESEAMAALNDVPASLSDGSKISELSREVAWLHNQITMYREKLGEHGPAPVMPSLHAGTAGGSHGSHGSHHGSGVGSPVGSTLPYIGAAGGNPASPNPGAATPPRPYPPRSPLVMAKSSTLGNSGNNSGGQHSPIFGPQAHPPHVPSGGTTSGPGSPLDKPAHGRHFSHMKSATDRHASLTTPIGNLLGGTSHHSIISNGGTGANGVNGATHGTLNGTGSMNGGHPNAPPGLIIATSTISSNGGPAMIGSPPHIDLQAHHSASPPVPAHEPLISLPGAPDHALSDIADETATPKATSPGAIAAAAAAVTAAHSNGHGHGHDRHSSHAHGEKRNSGGTGTLRRDPSNGNIGNGLGHAHGGHTSIISAIPPLTTGATVGGDISHDTSARLLEEGSVNSNAAVAVAIPTPSSAASPANAALTTSSALTASNPLGGASSITIRVHGGTGRPSLPPVNASPAHMERLSSV
jgi:hypothetical protein